MIFLGAVGLGLVAHSLVQLCRANVPLRKLLLPSRPPSGSTPFTPAQSAHRGP